MHLKKEAVVKAYAKLTGMVLLDEEVIDVLYSLCSEKMNDFIQDILHLLYEQVNKTGKKHISMDIIYEAAEKLGLKEYSRVNVIPLGNIDDQLCEDFYFPSAFEKSKFHSFVNRTIEDIILKNPYWLSTNN